MSQNAYVTRLGDDYDKPSDQLPKFATPEFSAPHGHEHLIEVGANDLFEGSESGLTYKIEFKVLESPVTSLVGRKFVHLIGGLDQRDGDLKKRNLKEYHAAVFGIDPTSDQKWSKIAQVCVDEQKCRGKQVRVYVAAPKRGKRNPEKFHCIAKFSPV